MSTRILKDLLIIRRLEFYVVELTIFSMPVLVTARTWRALITSVVIEGLIMYFLLYSLGDMINCLADRELDRTYKSRLSKAVYGLGVPLIRKLVIAEAILALLIAIHLSWTTGRWLILALVVLGIVLGVQYSVGPLHFKARGVWHLVCLWLLLYFLPMICASLLLQDALTWPILLLAASYATVEMGIILINTSEDLPEDLAAGIKTTTVALGLDRTLWLASLMVLVGGLAFLAFWAHLYWQVSLSGWAFFLLAAPTFGCYSIYSRMRKLLRQVQATMDQQSRANLVKRHGPLVPIWATIVGWLGVLCGVVPLILRNR